MDVSAECRTADSDVFHSIAGGARRWSSLHLFLREDPYGAAADAVIRSCVTPVMNGAVVPVREGQCFFIRYTEDGPHIRLRVMIDGDQPVGQHALEQFARGQSNNLIDRIAWKEYEPELFRYGGVDAMPIVERAFVASTRFTLQRMASTFSIDRGRRLGVAVLTMLTMAKGFAGYTSPQVMAFAERYAADMNTTYGRHLSVGAAMGQSAQRQAAALAPIVAAAAESLDGGRDDSDLTVLYREMDSCRSALSALASSRRLFLYGTLVPNWPIAGSQILASLIHMSNNRLGVVPIEEAYVADLLLHALHTAGNDG
jgi:thiopeptide-type bacteriocin biosynthesis protein